MLLPLLVVGITTLLVFLALKAKRKALAFGIAFAIFGYGGNNVFLFVAGIVAIVLGSLSRPCKMC